MPSTDLNTLTEDAVITYIQAVSTHGQDTGLTPRRWGQVKFNDQNELDDIELPAIVVRASRDQQLHTKVAVWKFTVDIWLFMQADDTLLSDWNSLNAKLEQIFSVDELAQLLNSLTDTYHCRGIVSRMVGDKVIDNRHWRIPYRLILWASHREQ